MPPKRKQNENGDNKPNKKSKPTTNQSKVDIDLTNTTDEEDSSDDVVIVSDNSNTNRSVATAPVVEPIRTQEGMIQGYNVRGPNYSGTVRRAPGYFMERISVENTDFQNDLNNTSSGVEQYKKIKQRMEQLTNYLENEVESFFNEFRAEYEDLKNQSVTDTTRKQQNEEFANMQLEEINNTEEQAKDDLRKLLEDLENLKTNLYSNREVMNALRTKELTRFGRRRVNVHKFLDKYVKLGNTREKGLKKLMLLQKFFN